MNNTLKISIASSIIAIGLIASAHTLSRFYLRMEKEKVIRVKGFAQKRLTSDKASLSAIVTVQSPSIAEGHKLLLSQTQQVRDLIAAKQITAVAADNVDHEKIYKRNLRGERTNEVDYYELSQRFRVSAKEVRKIEELSQEIGALLSKGYEVDIYGPHYYITDLSGVKMQLLAKATEDGYKRAKLMADNSGGKVGKLVEAQQGIFQITEPDSTETSGYGIYDTGTIEKDIKAVVTLRYLIE